MFDTHAHLNLREFKDDLENTTVRAAEKNIGIIVCGVQMSTSERGVKIAQQFSHVYAAVGLHPEQLRDIEYSTKIDNQETVSFKTKAEIFNYDKYRALAVLPKVVAIGEVGLDYYQLPDANREQIIFEQKQAFIRQIDLANELNLPMLIHTRECDADAVEILKTHPVKASAVLHSYVGGREAAEELLQMGYYFGFNGIITFKKAPAHILEFLKDMPADKILIETDCPYLTPEPFRGKRNEPAYVEYVLRKIAEVRGISVQQAEIITDKNTKTLFNIQ